MNVSNQYFHRHIFLHLLQLDTLAVEQELCNLRKDCEEKDATIKELSTFLQSSEVYSSKVTLFTSMLVSISS